MKSSRRQRANHWPSHTIRVLVALATAVVALRPAVVAQTGSTGEHWVGTWATALVGRMPDGTALAPVPPAPPVPGAPATPTPTPEPPLNFDNQTLRQIVHTSIGGDRARVVLANTFGTAPLAIGAANIAIRDKGGSIATASSRSLTFSGRTTATIPAGAVLVSDAVNIKVPPLSDVAVDLYLPGNTATGSSPLTMHTGALQTNYVSASGNHAGAAEIPSPKTTQSWFYLARVEVAAPQQTGAVVTIGDSITDGSRSTPDTNNRWPDHLARRLAAQNVRLGVLNVGIGGNRLLTDGVGPNALARFDREVLAQTGVTQVVVLEGINDLGLASRSQTPVPAADDLIAAHRQLVERAHARGLRIYAGTLTPFDGTTIAGYWSKAGDDIRQAVNRWLRTSKTYDGIIDFEEKTRDPGKPTWFLAQFDSGDHLHPGDAGYKAMADVVPLELLTGRTAVAAAAAVR
jgi:lysophospholipase L1-like esterase